MEKNKRLRTYLVWTFLITGLSWWGLALLVKFNLVAVKSPVYTGLHVLGGFGPTIASLLVLDDRKLKSVKEFIFSSRPKSFRFLLAYSILLGLTIGLSSKGLNPEIPYFIYPFILFLTSFFGGGNEELGWRGTMQPIMERKLPFPLATLVTGLVWGIWHLPLWFIEGMGQRQIPYHLFVVYGLFLSFFLAAIYKRTKSIFCCMIFHGLSNTLMSIFIFQVNTVHLIGLGLMVALSIISWYRQDERDRTAELSSN